MTESRSASPRTAGIRVLVLLVLAAGCGVARAGEWTWNTEFTTRVDYYDDEDLFGGRYAPLYQTVVVESSDGAHLRLFGDLYATKDLASDAELGADFRSLYLELSGLGKLARLRAGRFAFDRGVGYDLLDGAAVELEARRDLAVEAYLGRNTILYDTRFLDSPFHRAPFSDTGLLYGARLSFAPAAGELALGYSAFDSGTDVGRQDYLTFAASRTFPGVVRLDLRGYEDLSADSGSELHLNASHRSSSGLDLDAFYDRLRPDRLNPEVVTRVFVAEQATIAGGGLGHPLGEHLTIDGGYEGYWFDSPGGLEQRSHALRVGLGINYWLAAGLEAKLVARYLTGEAGDLGQLAVSGEKRLRGWLKLGWDLAWVSYRREGEEREDAYLVAGRLDLRLHPDLWLRCELEDYSNIDFDYNLRARFTLGYRLSNVGI